MFKMKTKSLLFVGSIVCLLFVFQSFGCGSKQVVKKGEPVEQKNSLESSPAKSNEVLENTMQASDDDKHSEVDTDTTREQNNACISNLKQWGLIVKMYANESPGEKLPPVVRVGNTFVPDLRELIPEYLTDSSICICPSNPKYAEYKTMVDKALKQSPVDYDTLNWVLAQNYTYFGWTVTSEREFKAMLKAISEIEQDPKDSKIIRLKNKDLQVSEGDGNGESGTIYFLREGVERFLVTDLFNPNESAEAKSKIPVMMDNINSQGHNPPGGNILYMDGHIEEIIYPGEFPASKTVWSTLSAPQEPPN